MILCDYIERIAAMQYGLTKTSVRKSAYRFVVANKKNIPPSWSDNETAGVTWMAYFMKRHSMTFRKPEKRSKHRNECFNRTNVKRFHDNIEDAQSRLGPKWESSILFLTLQPNARERKFRLRSYQSQKVKRKSTQTLIEMKHKETSIIPIITRDPATCTVFKGDQSDSQSRTK